MKVLWLVVILLCTISSAHAETLLRWKFKSGETLRYTFVQKSQTETTGAGKPTTAAIDMTMQLTWRVEQMDQPGTATITQTIDQLKTAIKVDNLDAISYDSSMRSPASGPAKDIADAVGALIGAPCTVRLSDRGEILSVEPSPQLRDALARKKGNNLFSADGLSRVVRQASLVLPEKAVEPGESWNASVETPSPLGQLDQDNQCTYVGPMQRDGMTYEQITVETKLSLKPAKDVNAAPIVIKESEQHGTIWFDASAGRLAASELKQRLVTERPYRDMTIRIQTTSTMEMKLVPAIGNP